MAEEEPPGPLNLNSSSEGTENNQEMMHKSNMIHSHDGMRYRGDARSYDGHQVTRYFFLKHKTFIHP